MVKNILLLFIISFLFGCTSFQKKQNISLKEEANALCFIENKFLFINDLTITKINESGINVKTEPNGEEFLIKRSCLIEKKNINKKSDNLKENVNFACILDTDGFLFLKGENYQVINLYEDGGIIELFNKRNNSIYLVPKEKCDIVKAND